MTGYPAGWSVAAARAAITAGAPVLLPLLNDFDPAIRIDAAYALATAADPDHTIRTDLTTRLATEQDAIVLPPCSSPPRRAPGPRTSADRLVAP
ncbi:hypothetical protein [Streptomyces sp. NPDC048252]|uniref:hypothetical protein n=1 Tax=Streptomyces sp. NPDC048252 TaxID=3154612 RepID=UPI0034154666